MRKIVKRIWMGAGYLEGYGHHPGWTVIAIYVVASGFAGIEKGGLRGFFVGAAIAIGVILPIFLAGCYSRAKDYEMDVEHTFEKLKKEYE